MNFIKTYISAVILLLAIMILFGALTGCRTVKYVEREKLVYDSTAIKNLEAEKKVSRQLREENERLKNDSTGIRVEFFPDKHPINKPISGPGYGRIVDTSIINRLRKIDTSTWYQTYPDLGFYDIHNTKTYPDNGYGWIKEGKSLTIRLDGTIEATGDIKSVSLTKKAQEVIKKKVETHTDSLAIEKRSDAVSVTATHESSTKSVKRKWGQTLWPLAIAFILGCIITYYRHRIPVLGPILKFINGRLSNRIPPRP